jgi:hypothetical protein
MAKERLMKITSRSTPPGGAPFDMTLSIYDEVGNKRFDTEEAFREALLTYTKATPAGIENTLKMLTEQSFIICEAHLNEAGRKLFGLEHGE